MCGLKQNIIEMIKEVIFSFDEIEKAMIFGSRARGDYKNTSDIDIAIFANSISSTTLNLLRNELDELDIIYKIDVVDYHKLNKVALKNNIDNEGIDITSF